MGAGCSACSNSNGVETNGTRRQISTTSTPRVPVAKRTADEPTTSTVLDPELVYFDAVYRGDVLEVKTLLQSDPGKVKLQDGEARTGMHLAAESCCNQAAMVELLLEYRAAVDPTCKDGRTPLTMAVEHKDLAVSSSLLAAKAAVDGDPDYPIPPLLIGVINSHVETVTMLCQAKADPAKDLRDGSHCLSVAVTESTVPVVEELLKFVPSVDTRDTRGYTALLKAVSNKQKNMVQMLLSKKADVNAEASDGSTVLCVAAQTNDNEILKVLLNNGAQAKERSTRGYSPLMHASFAGSQDMVGSLLKAKADASHCSVDGWHACLSVVVKAPLELIGTVLRAVPDGYADRGCVHWGCTPLMWAVRLGRAPSVISLLLQKKASLETKDHRGRDAVMWAVLSKQLGPLQHLIESGAKCDEADGEGNSPLDIARNRNLTRYGRECVVSQRIVVVLTEALQSSGRQGSGRGRIHRRALGTGDTSSDGGVSVSLRQKQKRGLRHSQSTDDMNESDKSLLDATLYELNSEASASASASDGDPPNGGEPNGPVAVDQVDA